MSESDRRDLREWVQRLIQNSRDQEEGFEQSLDLTAPCQVEVFWLQDDLEGQVFVNTKDSSRDDAEILIHGPYGGAEFVGKVGEVAQEERWQDPLPPSSMLSFRERKDATKADALATFITRFVQKVQESVFSDLSIIDRPFHGSMRLWENCYTQYTVGDIRQNDVGELYQDGADNGQRSTASSQLDEPESQDLQGEKEEKLGGGGHIYPPVWIEKPPEKTFEEKVWNTGEIGYDIVFREDFLGDEVVVLRDGLILVLIQDGEEIRDILNTIFSVGVLLDIEWRALQGRELVTASVGPNGVKNAQAELSIRRKELLSIRTDSRRVPRGVIAVDGLRDLFDLAEQIYPKEAIREKLILHLQAYTHLLDHEYTASFLLNWNIIEQQIIDILTPHLRENYDVNSDRRRNMERGSHWSISHILEVAEITDAITDDQYSKLDGFRRKRNNIVHKLETASGEQAEELNDIVSSLVEREINNELSFLMDC